MSSLQVKIQKDFIFGKKSENLFMLVAELYGYETLRGSYYHDTVECWDVLIKKDGKKARVQVKGLKDAHKIGYTWIELKRYDGKHGWLYGNADVLAIRTENSYDIYQMDLIRDLINERVDKTKPMLRAIPKKENGENDYEYMRFREYNGFYRRDDITVIVSFDDIKHCKVFTVKYDINKLEIKKEGI